MRTLLKSFVIGLLWRRASRVIKRDQPFIIAITGSVGKTTTKDAIAAVLAADTVPVHSAAGNLNTEFGVPLAIMGFNQAPHGVTAWLGTLWRSTFIRSVGKGGYRLVLELSSDKDGDIAFLAERIPINLAVFTRFTITHERGDEAVAKEKLSMLKGLAADGTVVANADDTLQKPALAEHSTVTYGTTSKADVQYGVKQFTPEGIEMTITEKDKTTVMKTKVVAEHQLLSLAAAVAVARQLKISYSTIAQAIEAFLPPKGRMRIIEGRKQATLIDDSYNSSPAAAELALMELKRFAGTRRTVAILGNMNELGSHTVSAHVALGQAVAAAQVDYLVAVGQNATRIVRGAREGGMADQHMITFKTPEKMMARLDHLVRAKDVILIKASQNGMRFERVVKKLMAHPDQARELLVRQDY